jgi:hypothetical protein
MPRLLFACALLAATVSTRAAEPAPVPKPDCGQPPKVPGPQMRNDDFTMKHFKADVKKFQECLKGYVDEQQAIAKAHADAASAAAEDYNKAVNDINAKLKEAD